MPKNLKLNYVEFPTKDIQATKKFFVDAFGWSFTDFGGDCTAFADQWLESGFYTSNLSSLASNGSALLVLLTDNLEQAQSIVESFGGKISTPIFSFPGESRFHFIEPGDDQFAV
jgi:predicted enzyme related to lactoylglutathione lyase